MKDPENSPGGSDLVERIRSGDRQAEDELFHRYRRGVFAILRHRGVSLDAADDLFQETIMIVLAKIKKGAVRQPDQLSAFVCGVARNCAIIHFRKESRLAPLTDAHLNIGSPPRQHEELMRKQEAEAVREVIHELRQDRDRQILFRYYVQAEEKEKICEDLQLNSLEFNRVLWRAHQRFRELFEKRYNVRKV